MLLPRRWVWPIALTALGAWLRWYRLDDTRLIWDHAYPVAQAIALAVSGIWPKLGQPTTFFLSNPPGQAYISLLPWSIFQSFWLVFWAVTTLNILAVPLIYRLSSRVLPSGTAVIVTVLYATSPWVVDSSRATWSAALLPVGNVLVLGLLLQSLRPGITKPNQARLLLAMFLALTLLAQTYFLAMTLTPLQAAVILLLHRRRLPRRWLLIGSLIFAAGLALYATAVATDWVTQAPRIDRFVKSETVGSPASFKPAALRQAIAYVTGGDFAHFPETSNGAALNTIAGISQFGLALVLGAGVVRAVGDLWRRRSQAWLSGALLIWWVLPILPMSYNSLILHPFHLKPTLPAGHWLAAYGASGLLARWPKLRRPGYLAGMLVVAASLATLDQPLRSNAARPVSADLDSSTLQAARQIGTDLRRFLDAYALDEVYVGLPDVTPTAWAGRPLAAISWFEEPDLLIVPLGRPSLYVRSQVGTAPGPLPLAQRLQTQTWPGQGIVAYDLLPALTASEAAALPEVSIGWPSDTGLTLLGYSLEPAPRVGVASLMTTYWIIETLVDTRDQFIFGSYAHLNDRDGATLVIAGASGLPGYYYRQGDLYIQSFPLPIPADLLTGTYQLDLGLYDGLHQVSASFYPPNDTPRPFYTADVDVSGASSVGSH